MGDGSKTKKKNKKKMIWFKNKKATNGTSVMDFLKKEEGGRGARQLVEEVGGQAT